MLPARKSHGLSLADVMPSCLASIQGAPNPLGLPPVDKAVVLVADGLGAAALRARAGHARTLAPLLRASTIDAGFPTTTAAALTTIATGVWSGEHGLVGYTVLDSANSRIVNQLTGWDAALDPATWQRTRTLFQRAVDAGIPSFAIGPENFRDSGFTAAVLRGAQYLGAASIAQRLGEARRVFDSADRALVYVYTPELDKTAHAVGWETSAWTDKLEMLDGAVREFASELRGDEGLLLTADHGVLDVPRRSQVYFDTEPGLVEGIRFVAGDPRCIQLHFEPDAGQSHRDLVLDRWRESEGGRAWVATRAQAISAGWFGPTVDREVVPRIGDILVAARKSIAYYDSRTASAQALAMVGQHGSWSPDEVIVPLLRFGAFARR